MFPSIELTHERGPYTRKLTQPWCQLTLPVSFMSAARALASSDRARRWGNLWESWCMPAELAETSIKENWKEVKNKNIFVLVNVSA